MEGLFENVSYSVKFVPEYCLKKNFGCVSQNRPLCGQKQPQYVNEILEKNDFFDFPP